LEKWFGHICWSEPCFVNNFIERLQYLQALHITENSLDMRTTFKPEAFIGLAPKIYPK